jgi:hypothetical protein
MGPPSFGGLYNAKVLTTLDFQVSEGLHLRPITVLMNWKAKP